MAIRQIASKAWRWLDTMRAGNLMLVLVAAVSIFNLSTTVRLGAVLTSKSDQQVEVLVQQTAILQQLVAGQEKVRAATESLQVKATTWKYKDPATGACVSMTITTTQQAGEPDAEFEARHHQAVRENQALFPPDPSCP